MEISKLNGSFPIQPGDTTNKVSTNKADLGDTFKAALENLSAQETNSDTLMQKLAAGEDVEIHEVMIAMEETDVSFRVAMAIRDKLIESYQEIMRLQI